MTNFKDIEDALAAQVIAQTEAINANGSKGNALEYADQYDDNGGRMAYDITNNVSLLITATDPIRAKKAAVNSLNYILFYMINRGLL